MTPTRLAEMSDHSHDAAMSAARCARRLDWRFLLPMAHPVRRAVLVGADAPLLAAARTVGVAEEVSGTWDGSSCDLVAVLADGEATDLPAARDVAAALAPGGVVWWETDRRRPGERLRTPGRLARHLASSGLEVLSVHALRPEPGRCEWYVPLDHPAAARWFVDSLYAPVSRGQWIGELVLRASTGLRPDGLSHWVPFHAVAARRPTAGPVAGDVMTTVRRALDAESVAQRCGLVTHGGGRAVLLGFDEGCDRPSVVVKAPLTVSAPERSLHEHRVTSSVRAIGDPVVRAAVPEPLGVHDVGSTVIAQAAVPGTSLARSTVRRGRRLPARVADLQAVATWLETLHRHPIDAGHRWDDSDHDTVHRRIENYRLRFGSAPGEQNLFERTLHRSRHLRGRPVPVVWEHRDLSVWNVMRAPDSVFVLDWEGATHGWPLADLLRLTAHWHELVLRCRARDEQRRALQDLVAPCEAASAATRAARRVIDRYVDALRLPCGLEDVLHVAGWAELAVRRDDHDRSLGVRDGDPREGNNAVNYLTSLTTVLA